MSTRIYDAEHHLGTKAERLAMDTAGLSKGSDFYETDTGDAYLWDGAAWCLV